MKLRDIYIVSQDELDPKANAVAAEAISDVMDCFPQYKANYPITDLGAWKDPDYRYIKDGKIYLRPYMSTLWHIGMAKLAALNDGRSTQLNVYKLLELMQSDPTNQQIPQFTILLTKDDLYPDRSMNYCLGVGREGLGCIVSAARYSDKNGKLVDIENFKTVVAHEFGHVIGLTYSDRKNSVEMLGPHCADTSCIMQQRVNGDYSDVTRARIQAKRMGLPPICPDCIEAGNKFFGREYERVCVLKAFRDFGINHPR